MKPFGNEAVAPAPEAQTTDRPPDARPPRDTLAEDWLTIWQSEAAAMAGSREAAEAAQAMVTAWADAARGMLRAITAGYDHPSRPAGSTASARPPPPAASPDPGRDTRIADALDRLSERIAGLEQRLDRLEPGPGRKSAKPKRIG